MVFEHVSIVLLHFGRDEKLLKGGGNMETCALKDIYIYRTRGEEILHYLYCVRTDVGVAARRKSAGRLELCIGK